MAKTDKQEVVVAGDKEKLQVQLRAVLVDIEAKISQLSGGVEITKGAPATTYLDEWNTGIAGGTVTIANHTDVQLLLKLASLINLRKREYDDIATSAGLTVYPNFMWQGYDGNLVVEALIKRAKLLSNTAVINSLKAEKKRLEEFLSEDDRLANSLQNVIKLLKTK